MHEVHHQVEYSENAEGMSLTVVLPCTGFHTKKLTLTRCAEVKDSSQKM